MIQETVTTSFINIININAIHLYQEVERQFGFNRSSIKILKQEYKF